MFFFFFFFTTSLSFSQMSFSFSFPFPFQYFIVISLYDGVIFCNYSKDVYMPLVCVIYLSLFI